MPVFERGNAAALRHGSTSNDRIRPLAANHRRRVLRQLGLSPRDLSPLARGHLNLYVRLAAKIDLIDRYVAEHGLIRPDGEPQQLGHSSPSVTLDVYSHLFDGAEHAERARDALEAGFGGLL